MDDNTRVLSSKLYSDSMSKIKKTKIKFSNFIKYKNENKIELSPKITKHLKILIKLWNNNENANIEYYFNMKEHHSYITGELSEKSNEELNKLWDDYIMSGLQFRPLLLQLNHILSEYH